MNYTYGMCCETCGHRKSKVNTKILCDNDNKFHPHYILCDNYELTTNKRILSKIKLPDNMPNQQKFLKTWLETNNLVDK